MELFLLIISAVLAFILSFAIGANDVSNALGTSVGSKALTVRQAIAVGAVFELLGVATMGHLVSGTLKSEIVSPDVYGNDTFLLAVGMSCTLAGSATWLIIATMLALPVSTTQTIVGGIIGFASIEKGFDNINMWKLLNIAISWVASPVLGGLVGFGIYYSIKKFIYESADPYASYLRLFPFYSAFTFSVLMSFGLATLFQYFGVPIILVILVIAVVFLITLLIFMFVIMPCFEKKENVHVVDHKSNEHSENSLKEDKEFESLDISIENYDKGIIEEKFKYLMILSAIFVSFAHGGNDVANAIGPFSAVLDYCLTGYVDPESSIPFYVILAGGVGIDVGLALLGYKVMETIGEKITKLSFSRGYSAQFSAAFTVLIATALGFPISTTSVLVGGVAGTGLAKENDEGGIDHKVLIKIIAGWVFTIIAGFCLTSIFYYITRALIRAF